MSHATRTGYICNFSEGQIILNMYDGRILPSLGPLCGVLPWHSLITFVREGHMLLNYKGLETSGPLSGDVLGEVDHQWLGLTRVFII